MRRLERLHATAAFGKLLQVGQFPLVHPLPDEPGVHPVKTEDDEFLPKRLSRTPRSACGAGPDKQDGQEDEDTFHDNVGEEQIITSDHWANWTTLERKGPAVARQRFGGLGTREDGLSSETMLEQTGEGRKEFDWLGDGARRPAIGTDG